MYQTYQIKNGETLEMIAHNLGITLEELKKINSFTVDTMPPGTYIVIPTKETELLTTYRVQKGDTLHGIARKYGISAEDLASINGLELDDYIYPDQEIVVPKPGVSIYVTKEHDTFMDIANLFQVNPAMLLSENEKIILMPNQMIAYKKENFQ